MTSPAADPSTNGTPRGDHIPRGWVHLASLALLTLAGVAVCGLLVWPFLPALAWAVALAIIAHPLHRWVSARVSTPSMAALATTSVVVLVIVVPTLLVAEQLAVEATAATQQAQQM